MRAASNRTRETLVIIAALAIGGCRATHEVEPRRVLRLIVSSSGGVNYDGLAQEYTDVVTTIEFRPFETTSSLEALEALQQGRADVGFVMADLTYLGFAGRLEGQSGRFDRLRAIFASGVLGLHLVVRNHSGIGSLSDLPGHSIGIGVGGSAIERLASATLKAFGISLSAIHVKRLPSMLAVEELRSGAIQAMFVIGAFPGPSPAEAVRLALATGAYLLPIEGSSADRLREMNRYFRLAVIPAGTYSQQLQQIATIGVQNLLICRTDLDEQLVYELTKGFFQAVPRSPLLIDAFRSTDLEQAAATLIPLHEGAARYYRERDLFQ